MALCIDALYCRNRVPFVEQQQDIVESDGGGPENVCCTLTVRGERLSPVHVFRVLTVVMNPHGSRSVLLPAAMPYTFTP